MRGIPTRGRGLSRRQTSEKALLDAFEALLERHGPGGLGVNAVLDSARVGKRLLYEYFGDLEGLANAWSRERRDPLSIEGRRPALARSLATLPPLQAIAQALADYANELRRHPWAAQVLLAELSQPATLGRAMREIRRELGKDYEGLLVETGAFASKEAALLPVPGDGPPVPKAANASMAAFQPCGLARSIPL
jgi:AcrR family transcriptional regulator